MGPSLPLVFQPEPCAQSSQWGRFLDRITQHGPESEERNGSMRRCPTCGNLSPRKFFLASLHPPRSSYGLLSEHPPELYAGSYLSSSLHSAPPHTPCGLMWYISYVNGLPSSSPLADDEPFRLATALLVSSCRKQFSQYGFSLQNFPYQLCKGILQLPCPRL